MPTCRCRSRHTAGTTPKGWPDDSSGPVVLELTGGAGGTWLVGDGRPIATVRADAVAYMRTLAGRDDDPVLEVVSGDSSARAATAAARYPF
jgi:hypothetical protein